MSEQLRARFERLGAPEALRQWVETNDPSAAPPRPYRMWWLGVHGEAIDDALVQERDELVDAIESLVGASETQRWNALFGARDTDHESLAEQIAERVAVVTTGYREAPHEHIRAGFAALSWLSRALGAVESARARRVAAREVRARELAALVGAGQSAFLRDSEGLRVDTQNLGSPVNSELAYAFSALAEAWREVQTIGAVA